MPRSLDELDAWARDHELRHRREDEDRRREGEMLIAAVKRHVDGALAPLRGVPEQLAALAKVNDEQLAIAKESAEERGRRLQREVDAAAKKSTEELEIERLKARNMRWQIVAGVITAIAVAFIGALLAH